MRIFSIFSMFISAYSFGCDNATEKYYTWASLKVFPEKVSSPITKAEAERKELNGEAYYIQLICDSGDVLMLTKRLNGAVFFQIDYLDNAEGIYGKITTNSNGDTTKYVHR